MADDDDNRGAVRRYREQLQALADRCNARHPAGAYCDLAAGHDGPHRPGLLRGPLYQSDEEG